jgi:dUTP pyrophosphatase
MKNLKFKKLDEKAITPTRATCGSCGYDLYALTENQITIFPNQRELIHTGIAIGLEDLNTVALIYARSGIATKFGIIPANCVGVIDADYRGKIMVTLTNLSDKSYIINPNDRIAQMVTAPVFLPDLVEVDDLDDTSRGDSCFGSTGV